MVIRKEGNHQQNQKRQQDHQNQEHQSDTRCHIFPPTQVDLMRLESLAGHGGETFDLRGESSVEVNEDKGDHENADTVGCR